MSKLKIPFVGSCVALVTPFRSDYSIDFEALGNLIDFQINSGTDAILILGTTGESSTMTDSERRACISYAADKIGGRVPLIVGTGTNRTAYSVDLSRYAKSCGCDGVLVVTPYYNKASADGLIRHFSLIADAADCSTVLYNIPSRTGMNIPMIVYEKLAAHPNITAVKEASGDISYAGEIAARFGNDLALYSGNDDQTLPLISLGGKGVISVAANIVPKMIRDLCHSAINRSSDAVKLQADLHYLFSALFCEVNPIPVKTACEILGLCSDTLRLPLCEISDGKKHFLISVLKKYKLI